MAQTRYTASQQLGRQLAGWIPWLFGGLDPDRTFRLPAPDPRTHTRALDTSEVEADPDARADWDRYFAALGRELPPFGFGSSRRPTNGYVAGFPIQYSLIGAVHSVPFFNPWTHEAGMAPWPFPEVDERWIEGYPSRDGEWDRHHVVVTPAGVYEYILTFPDIPRVGPWALYAPTTGELLAGVPVTNGGVSLARTVLGTDEPDHVLALTVPDYAAGLTASGGPSDGLLDTPFPRSGQRLRLTKAAHERLSRTTDVRVARVVNMARHKGVVISDKTGTWNNAYGIATQAGAFDFSWAGMTLRDFEPARAVPSAA